MQEKPKYQLKKNSSWAEAEYMRINNIKAGMKYSFLQIVKFKYNKLKQIILKSLS